MTSQEDKQRGVFIDGLDGFVSLPVEAFAGAGDRVHRNATKALDDKVSNGLASEWMNGHKPDDPLNIPFKSVVEDATANLEVYEKLLVFARWRVKNAAELGIKL